MERCIVIGRSLALFSQPMELGESSLDRELAARDAHATGATTPLLERVSFLVHRVNAQMLRICNPHFQKWGVDLVTSRMLVALMENESLTAGEIVQLMALPQSTISHQLKRLEKLGYISRESGEADSRTVIARLTGEGREVAHAANALSREIVAQMLQEISEDDARSIRTSLRQMDKALASMR